MGSVGGLYLAGLRDRRALSLDQVVHILATRYQIQISRSALSRYETGARKHPDAMLLWGLSRVYAEPLEQIIVGSRGRRDLIRHDARTDSADAGHAQARDLDLAERLEGAIGTVSAVVLALRGEAQAARASATARTRAHRKTG